MPEKGPQQRKQHHLKHSTTWTITQASAQALGEATRSWMLLQCRKESMISLRACKTKSGLEPWKWWRAHEGLWGEKPGRRSRRNSWTGRKKARRQTSHSSQKATLWNELSHGPQTSAVCGSRPSIHPCFCSSHCPHRQEYNFKFLQWLCRHSHFLIKSTFFTQFWRPEFLGGKNPKNSLESSFAKLLSTQHKVLKAPKCLLGECPMVNPMVGGQWTSPLHHHKALKPHLVRESNAEGIELFSRERRFVSVSCFPATKIIPLSAGGWRRELAGAFRNRRGPLFKFAPLHCNLFFLFSISKCWQ